MRRDGVAPGARVWRSRPLALFAAAVPQVGPGYEVASKPLPLMRASRGRRTRCPTASVPAALVPACMMRPLPLLVGSGLAFR